MENARSFIKLPSFYTVHVSLLASILSMLISLLVFLQDFSYDIVRLLVCCSFFCFFIALTSKLNNALFFLRTLIIGLVGYYPVFIKCISTEAYFSFVGMDFQTFPISIKIYSLTAFALLGNDLGLILGSNLKFDKNSPTNLLKKATSKLWKFFFYASIPIVILVGFLTASTAPPIYLAGYATQNSAQLLGNTQAIGIIAFLCLYIAQLKVNINFSKLILIMLGLYLFVWGMLLRGLRQDIISALMALYICQAAAKNSLPSISIKFMFFGFFVVVFSEIWGALRSVLVTENINIFLILDILKEITSIRNDVYHIGTVSPLTMNIVYVLNLVDSNQLDFIYGKSFLEFIPRTPPEFLYPARPQDYALMFNQFGLLSLGGFFEIAESYLNFGFAGAFLVTLPISFIFARLQFHAMKTQSIKSYFMLFGILALFLRGTWYQIFALYKTFITAMIIFYIFLILFFIFEYIQKWCAMNYRKIVVDH